MPVEIKELVIKAEFGDPRYNADDTRAAGGTGVEQDELIQECVRQVLEILDRKRER